MPLTLPLFSISKVEAFLFCRYTYTAIGTCTWCFNHRLWLLSPDLHCISTVQGCMHVYYSVCYIIKTYNEGTTWPIRRKQLGFKYHIHVHASPLAIGATSIGTIDSYRVIRFSENSLTMVGYTHTKSYAVQSSHGRAHTLYFNCLFINVFFHNNESVMWPTNILMK